MDVSPPPPLRQPPSATSSCWLDWLAALSVQRFLIAKGWKKKEKVAWEIIFWSDAGRLNPTFV